MGNQVHIEVDMKARQCNWYLHCQSKEVCAHTDLGKRDDSPLIQSGQPVTLKLNSWLCYTEISGLKTICHVCEFRSIFV